ncbi:MAG TPA: cation:proton antiporter [Firmicutes bacterium]|nr:cation:proton antiporter [Bacillota bacterium]
MHHNVLEIFLFLMVVILAAKAGGMLATRLGQPAVLGKILVGLILGPTIIGISKLPIFPESSSQIRFYMKESEVIGEVVKGHKAVGEDVSAEEVIRRIIEQAHDAIVETGELDYASGTSREIIAEAAIEPLKEAIHDQKSFLEDVIKVIAELGVLFLMFIAGLETDLALMRRVGKTAFGAAIGGVILPFLLGFVVTWFMIPVSGIYTAIFTGTILCATSVSISAQTLKELHVLTSKEGTCILGAAVIDDILGIILLSLVIAFNPVKHAGAGAHAKMYEVLTSWITTGTGMEGNAANLTGIVILIICMALFFFIFYFVGAVYFERFFNWVERLPVSEPKLSFAIGIGLLFAWAAEYIGAVAAITGTYLAGVLIGQTSHKHEIESKLSVLTYAFFVPVFFVNIGLEANIRTLSGDLAWFAGAVCVAAVIGKLGGSLIGAKMTGFSFIESLRVGTGMVSRGEVGLIVASVGLSGGIIVKEIFSAMVLMVLVTTLVTPIGLRMVFPRKDKAKPNPESG